MELQGLLVNLTMGTVWIYSGAILSLVRNKSYLYAKPYCMAKKYMSAFLVFSGVVTIIVTIQELLLGKELECLSFFTLFCNFVEAILFLLSVMSLFNHDDCMGYRLWRCFVPVLILVILYFVSILIFNEPKVYSVMELLKCIHLSPPIAIRFLIEFSIVAGVGFVVYKYVGVKKEYLSNMDGLGIFIDYEWVKWIDKMVVLMVLIGGLSILDSVVTWKLYPYINGTVSIGGIMYCVISFVNHRPELVPDLIVAEITDTDMVILLPAENDTDRLVSEVVENNIVACGEEGEIPNFLTEIDENYYYTKKAIDKWINLAHKPYLKGGITLKEAALGIGVSCRRLSDFIKNEYNCNFNTWINTLRIEEVKRYLLEEDTHLSLSYIADQTGFSDLSGMSNTFKKVMGIPPSLFRKQIVTKTIHEEMRGESQ